MEKKGIFMSCIEINKEDIEKDENQKDNNIKKQE